MSDTLDPPVFIRKFYSHLIDKYGWTVSQIENEDFWLLYDLEYGDWKSDATEEPVQYIDQVRAMYR